MLDAENCRRCDGRVPRVVMDAPTSPSAPGPREYSYLQYASSATRLSLHASPLLYAAHAARALRMLLLQ